MFYQTNRTQAAETGEMAENAVFVSMVSDLHL